MKNKTMVFIFILIMTFKEMANHLLHFQQVLIIYHIPNFFYHFIVTSTQAGLTNSEVKFKEWEWEEELSVLTLEDVGLGTTFVESSQSILRFLFQR